MIKFFIMLIFRLGLFIFNNKFNKSIILFFVFFCIIFLNIYSTNLLIGGINLFYIDLFSFYLILISLWIVGCLLLLNLRKFLEFIIFLILNILFICFLTVNILIFYLIFEISLLPIFFLIIYGGYTFERFEAIIYILIYTIVSSIPFLWLIIKFYINYKSLMIIYLIFKIIELSSLIYLLFILTFIVKIPLFLFHI